MNTPPSSQIVLHPAALFVFLFFLAVVIFYLIFRLLILKIWPSREKPLNIFLSKISLPLVLFFVAICMRLNVLKDTFFPNQKLHLYMDASLIFFSAFFLIRFIDALLFSWYAKRRLAFPVPRVLRGLILIVIYLIILFAVLKGILGIDITPFLATSALLTAIVGLAFQGVLSNILSGMSLHITKSFSKGDWVKVGQDEGVVIDTNWRETRILDRYSNIIVFPNSMVAAEKITNFSHPDETTALTYSVKASYQTSPSEVFDALLKAAREVQEVLDIPAPEAYALSYDDFGISYLLKFWISDFSRKYPISGEVGRKIWYNFKRRNIEIPIPLSDKLSEVLKSVKEKDAVPAIDAGKGRNFHALLNSSLLRYPEGEREGELLVSEDEIEQLASLVKRYRYTPDEVIFKQGDKGESCYILAQGLIKGAIVYQEKGKKYTTVFKVEPGGLFGEMSLFTGMPRTATGIVEEESEVLEIKAEDFGHLLERNKTLADVLAGLVSDRNRKNQAFLKKIKELSAKDIEQSCSKRSILERLRQFASRKK
ncbi:cyclic nucleotide-binding domain-containing protein [Acidobacteriota bacterium]